MRSSRACLIMICALLAFGLAGCETSRPATHCAGWVKNNLSPAGTVALIQADRPGYERVIGNDRNGERVKCW